MLTSEVRREKGWLAFLDVYGFGHTVSTEDNEKLANKISALQTFISTRLADLSDFDLYMFSDSIVVFHKSNDTQKSTRLEALADIIREIQMKGLEEEFLFRGAIVFGEMHLGPGVCIGAPLLKAAKWEQQLALPLVVIPESEIDRVKEIYLRNPGPQIIATKGGVVGGSVILPIPLDGLQQHVQKRQGQTLRTGPEDVAAVWCEFLKFLEQTRDTRLILAAEDTDHPSDRREAVDGKRTKRRNRKRA